MNRWWYGTSWPWPLWQGGTHRLPAGHPGLLLTFDDGPGEHTLDLAALLADRGTRALFFLDGQRALAHPERVAALAALGHTVGSHGLWHRRHAWRPPDAVTRELAGIRAYLQDRSGQPVHWLRPPYGSWAPWLGRAARAAGQHGLFWSLNPKDFAAPSAKAITDRVLALARPRDVLLLHCTGPGQRHTREALPVLLDGLHSRGLPFADPADLILPSL